MNKKITNFNFCYFFFILIILILCSKGYFFVFLKYVMIGFNEMIIKCLSNSIIFFKTQRK